MTKALSPAPVLTTERLVLRGPEREDLPAFTQFVTSSPAMAALGETGSEADAWFSFMTGIGHWHWHGYGFFILTKQDDNTPLGRVGLLNHSAWPHVELAWHLFEGAEGQGFATEAAITVRQWAHRAHGIAQLVSYIHHSNTRSQNVARRLGATTDSTPAPHEPDAQIWHHIREAA